ncbi:mitotic centromere-associated kinesin (MCAK) [Trypanosoma theileri]|uniref:Mitotic centromere-associated kinesin (MCAK) n=1 Tax=Trypanosoma theileri TaxID=67003 RepID=A0A1X0NJ40_9TRYP|nr:mitotic centromere-associated kinesin (MCAK) [Trypanosoma theileri]ORC84755.1 mitotic centromere-associated kinesin (MCAK) [Trypanosoma theileri]
MNESTPNGAHNVNSVEDTVHTHGDSNVRKMISSSSSPLAQQLLTTDVNSPRKGRNAQGGKSNEAPSLQLLTRNLDSLSREFEQLTARGRASSHSLAREEPQMPQIQLPRLRISSASHLRSTQTAALSSRPQFSPTSVRVQTAKTLFRKQRPLDESPVPFSAGASPSAGPVRSPLRTPKTRSARKVATKPPTTITTPAAVVAAAKPVEVGVEESAASVGCEDGRDTSPLRRHVCSPGRNRDGRIRVAVRKRPLLPGDVGVDCVKIAHPHVHVSVTKQRVDLSDYENVNDFTFDSAFDAGQTNADVFHEVCVDLLDVVLAGGSASCFAYGQTGSGKTHTMMGGNGESGLCAIAAAELFARVNSNTHVVCAALYEIYRNALFDLLNDRAPVVLRESYNRRMHVCGLTWHFVESAQALNELIRSGTEQRSTGSTSANEHSSRSHAVLAIRLCRRPKNNNNTTKISITGRSSSSPTRNSSSNGNAPEEKGEESDMPVSPSLDAAAAAVEAGGGGALNFVDLAGSERAADTAMHDRQTRHEGAEINKSLLALKECIRALDEKKRHVPFRGSKLTEILRDSFTGNSRTLMIANISGSSCDYEHTLNTLRYAFRVKGLSIESVVPSKARNAPRIFRPLPGDILHQQKLQQQQQQNNNNSMNNTMSITEVDAILRRPRPRSVAAKQRRAQSGPPGGNTRCRTPAGNTMIRKNNNNGINKKINFENGISNKNNNSSISNLNGGPSNTIVYEKVEENFQKTKSSCLIGSPSNASIISSTSSSGFLRVASSEKKLRPRKEPIIDVNESEIDRLKDEMHANLTLALRKQNELIKKLSQENAALRVSVKILKQRVKECPNCGWKLEQQ